MLMEKCGSGEIWAVEVVLIVFEREDMVIIRLEYIFKMLKREKWKSVK